MSPRLSITAFFVVLLGAGSTRCAPVAEIAAAPDPTPTKEGRSITLDTFLNEVLAENLDYAAQRYQVDLARAETAASRVWNNPTLALSANRDLTYHHRYTPDEAGVPVSQRMPESKTFGLSQSFDLSRKRHWREKNASLNEHAAAATLDDFLLKLKLDACAAFAEALSSRAALQLQQKAAGYFSQLAQAQKARYQSGDVSEADYLQSRLSELQFKNELRQAETNAASDQIALEGFLGPQRLEGPLVPDGSLKIEAPEEKPEKLIAQALASRGDLIALRLTRDSAVSSVSLAKAERFDDVEVGVSFTHNPSSQNFIAPAPKYNQLQVSTSIPLPLWNRKQHEIRKARLNADSAQRQLESAELKVKIEIRTRLVAYQAAVARVQEYKSELLQGADTVLGARRYSYDRGETSLLELIEAQRSAIDVEKSYHEAEADAMKAYIELSRATGNANINFLTIRRESP